MSLPMVEKLTPFKNPHKEPSTLPKNFTTQVWLPQSEPHPLKLKGFSHVWFLRDICPKTNNNWLTLLKTVLWVPNIHFHGNMYVRNHCYLIRNSQRKSAHKKCSCIQIPGNSVVLFPPTRAQAHIIYDKAAWVNKHSVYNVLNGSFKTII